MSESKCCEHCDDGNGDSIFPYFGVAPHSNTFNSQTLPESEFPENFKIDGEWTETLCNGVYTHCLNCGAGETVKIVEDA
jgi:hypothetical protein